MSNLNLPTSPFAGRLPRQSTWFPGQPPQRRNSPGNQPVGDHRHGKDIVTMQDIFVFQKQGIKESGEVLGEFMPTGIRPKFSERLLVTGVHLSSSMFEPPRVH